MAGRGRRWPWGGSGQRSSGGPGGRGACATTPSLRQQNPDPYQTDGGGLGFAQKNTSARWLAGTPFPKQQGPGPFTPPRSHWESPPPRNRGAAEAAPTAICRPHLPETPPARLLFPHSLQRWTEGWGRPGDPRSRYTEDGNKLPFQLRVQLGEAVTPRTYRRLWGRMHMNEKELFPISYSD